ILPPSLESLPQGIARTRAQERRRLPPKSPETGTTHTEMPAGVRIRRGYNSKVRPLPDSPLQAPRRSTRRAATSRRPPPKPAWTAQRNDLPVEESTHVRGKCPSQSPIQSKEKARRAGAVSG